MTIFAPNESDTTGKCLLLVRSKPSWPNFGMPGERWKTDPTMKYDKFIEVQVWDDRPINERLLQVDSPLSP
ncbi:hypothetical protein [Mesorhizobium sp. LNJC403B00]|uniref:hypothetical protein n=1 Tax=Mesorhizobium sp. LNJC403B00 TaxID=1287280 RepID=UPI0012EC9532|nr:hypothetical protein [Mesorhizobium sp. LNJC403B00]